MNIQTTMLSKMIRAYLFIGLTTYLIILLYWLNSVNLYNILNTTVCLSYAYMLWTCVNKDENYFTNRRLWLTVFLYSMIFVSLFLLLSYYYTGNTFLFSYIDARVYEQYSFRMKDMGFIEAIHYISQIWNYDDWGGVMSMAFILKIVPSKLFLNFCYVLMNTATALLLFDTGKMIGMSKKYAYMASLSYSIASYSLFMIGTFLKEETFILLIVLSMWGLYKYKDSSKVEYLILGGIVSILILFFRVPAALFIWLSYAVLLLLGDGSHIKKALFVILGIVVSVLIIGLWQYSVSRYANEGDITSTARYVSTSLFQKITGYISIMIGPFPTLHHITGTTLKYRALNGAGLLLKFILFLPFWKGLIYCVRTRATALYPMYVFTVASILGLMAVLRIDFRFAMPSMPFFLLAAFWYMDQYDCDADESIRATPYYYWTNMELKVCLCIVFIVTLAWNLLVRSQSTESIYMEHLQLSWPEI